MKTSIKTIALLAALGIGFTSPLFSQVPDLTKAGAITALALSCLPAVQAADAAQWEVFETSYESAKAYPNAFTEVEVDVVFKQGEKQWKVPAFWADALAGQFYLDGEKDKVASGSVTGNVLTLKLK